MAHSVKTSLTLTATMLALLSFGLRAQDPISISAALAHPERPVADTKFDANRKPAEVLAFFDIKPGAKVLDLFSGSGYYTEPISRIVGGSGQVIAHSNSAYRQFVPADLITQHYGLDGLRLPNVERRIAEVDDLELASDSLDFASLILTLHDFYFENDQWAAIDEVAFMSKLHTALKAGGRVGIVDHAAASGRGSKDAFTLHRIEKATVIALMADAGFELLGESDALANPDDDHKRSVFDPTIRRQTDRFILLFAKR